MKIYRSPSKIGTKFKSKIIRSNFFRRIQSRKRIYKFLKVLRKFILRFQKTPLELLFGYKLIEPTEEVTIYCDVSGIWDVSFTDGTRRVGHYFIEQLSQLQNWKFRIELVNWNGKTFVIKNKEKSKKFFPSRRFEWNPKKSDVLFLQTMEAVNRIRESKINKLNEKIKVVTLIYDILPILEPQWFTQMMIKNFEKNLEFALYFSNLLIVTSKTVENDVRLLSSGKYSEVTFPNLERVDISSVAKNFIVSKKNPKKKKLDKPSVILLISTIEPRKGYDELVYAASRALSEGANLKFIIVGRIGWVSDLFYSKFVKFTETFEDRISWLNNCDDETLAGLIPTVDIFLSPSRAEGFGIPVMEALISHVPTLTRDIPVYRELYDRYVEFYGPGNEFPDLYSAFVNIERIQKIASTKIEKFTPADSQDSIKSLLEVFGKITYG